MKNFHSADTPAFLEVGDVLAKHFGPSPPPVCVNFGALSHTGLVRTNNEDHFLVIERRRSRSILLSNLPEGFLQAADDVSYVMAVADGMGGAACGELASMLALRSGWEQAPNTIKWTWIINDQEIEELRERLTLIFRRMNQTLQARMRENPECTGMGTTLSGAYTVGPEAFIAHVGDSRVYLHHANTLTQLTRDHTLAQQCRDARLPVPYRSWNHILTNCLGGNDQEIRVEFHHVHLADEDQLLICTDGLTDLVRNEEIAGILDRHAPPQETAQILVDMALARGGRDNVTVIVAQYALVEPKPPS